MSDKNILHTDKDAVTAIFNISEKKDSLEFKIGSDINPNDYMSVISCAYSAEVTNSYTTDKIQPSYKNYPSLTITLNNKQTIAKHIEKFNKFANVYFEIAILTTTDNKYKIIRLIDGQVVSWKINYEFISNNNSDTSTLYLGCSHINHTITGNDGKNYISTLGPSDKK